MLLLSLAKKIRLSEVSLGNASNCSADATCAFLFASYRRHSFQVSLRSNRPLPNSVVTGVCQQHESTPVSVCVKKNTQESRISLAGGGPRSRPTTSYYKYSFPDIGSMYDAFRSGTSTSTSFKYGLRFLISQRSLNPGHSREKGSTVD